MLNNTNIFLLSYYSQLIYLHLHKNYMHKRNSVSIRHRQLLPVCFIIFSVLLLQSFAHLLVTDTSGYLCYFLPFSTQQCTYNRLLSRHLYLKRCSTIGLGSYISWQGKCTSTMFLSQFNPIHRF